MEPLPLPSESQPDPAPERLAAVARLLIAARRRRETTFPGVDFGEPAWDMLLALYLQRVGGHPFSVTSLCETAGVPTSTALRSLNAMVQSGHFLRTPDPTDARRTHIHLAPTLVREVESYLSVMCGGLCKNALESVGGDVTPAFSSRWS